MSDPSAEYAARTEAAERRLEKAKHRADMIEKIPEPPTENEAPKPVAEEVTVTPSPECIICPAYQKIVSIYEAENEQLRETVERIRFFAGDGDLDAIRHALDDSPIGPLTAPEWTNDLEGGWHDN